MIQTHYLPIFTLSAFILLFSSVSQAFQSSNIQLLYSNQFDGDAFIYDTQDGHKSTLTLEHFRTFAYGDVFAFVDIMQGTKFNNDTLELYGEIAPRLSLSKLSGKPLSNTLIKDTFIATQVNLGEDYDAWLFGLGVDLPIPHFNYFSANLYNKHDNFGNDLTQLTLAYQTHSFKRFRFEGFVDLTEQDLNSHNQFLFNISPSKDPIYFGLEWIKYTYDYQGIQNHSNAWQAMLRFEF